MRKELKEESLKKGQAIDKVANLIKKPLEDMEEYLEKQEKFIVLRDLRIRAELRLYREQQLEPYSVDTTYVKLESMTDDEFTIFLESSKKSFELMEAERLRKEKEAEEDKIMRAKLEEENKTLKIQLEEAKSNPTPAPAPSISIEIPDFLITDKELRQQYIQKISEIPNVNDIKLKDKVSGLVDKMIVFINNHIDDIHNPLP